MATFNRFNSWTDTMVEGANCATDQFAIALTNVAPTASNTVLADITQIAYTGFGSRNLTTASSSQASGIYSLSFATLTLGTTVTSPTFRYVVIYDDTLSGDPLVGWYDIGATTILENTSLVFRGMGLDLIGTLDTVLSDLPVASLGDSTVADYSGYSNVLSLFTEDVYGTTNAVPGHTIDQQKTVWNAISDLQQQNYKFIFIQVGHNDVDWTIPIATTITKYQALVTQVVADKAARTKVILCTMSPAKQRYINLYGGVNGLTAYNNWLALNEAIRGGGGTPITGADDYVDSHTDTLNDGSGNLLGAYDTGDAIHPNTAGRQIIADAWQAKMMDIYNLDPQVGACVIASTTGITGDTLNEGDTVTAAVYFTEAVTVTGTPDLGIKIGSATYPAAYVGGSGTARLTFTMTIVDGMNDADGISIPANSLRLNAGNAIAASGRTAWLQFAGMANNANYKVATTTPTYDPASEFTGGFLGGLYIPEPAYLFKDSAGTIPVVARGDVVQRINTAAGGSHPATNGTTQIAYNTDGIRHWLEVIVVSGSLSNTTMPQGDFVTAISAVEELTSNVGGRDSMSTLGSNKGWDISRWPTFLRIFVGSGSGLGTHDLSNTWVSGNKSVYSFAYNGTQSMARINTGTRSLLTLTYAKQTTNGIKVVGGASGPLDGKWFGGITVDKVMSDANQDKCVAFWQQRHG